MTEQQDAAFVSDATAHKVAGQIPADIRAALTPAQLARLVCLVADLAAPPRAGHVIAYRASTRFLGQEIYLALFSGAERRAPDRLEQTRQKRSLIYLLFHLTMGCLTLLALLAGAAVVLYLVKSFLGIDLFDGPSFLHEYVFGT